MRNPFPSEDELLYAVWEELALDVDILPFTLVVFVVVEVTPESNVCNSGLVPDFDLEEAPT